MLSFVSLFAAALLCASAEAPAQGNPCRSAADVRAAIEARQQGVTAFDFTARVTYVRTRYANVLAVEDDSGAVILTSRDTLTHDAAPGDVLHMEGVIRSYERQKRRAEITRASRVRRGHAPTPSPSSIRDILKGRYDYRLVCSRGEIRDCRRSETNANWGMLVLADGDGMLYVSVPLGAHGLTPLKELVGASVAITGVIQPDDFSERRNIGRSLKVAGEASVELVKHPGASRIPALDSVGPLGPNEVAALGQHVVSGRVLAVWAQNCALLEATSGTLHGLSIAEGRPPKCGQLIEAVGFPESDLFHINLAHVSWTAIGDGNPSRTSEKPEKVRARDLVTNDCGAPCYPGMRHGQLLSLTGELLSIADDANGFGRMFVRADGIIFPVEFSADTARDLGDFPVSSLIEATGICIFDTDSWRPNSAFPQIRGFRLVTRGPGDILILRAPPFWTSARLFTVISALLGALLAIIGWNIALRRKAELRGRKLAQETIARLASELKVKERTHLAVELHDTLSQTITGACLEVNAAQEFIGADNQQAVRHLNLAAKTLGSCRNELRNCLWDLRSRALEESDLNVAIRRTLEPYLKDEVALSIRFNVPRKNLPDNTAHALMRITRELVLNAIRHGQATCISVAGCIDNGRLRFSVRDNGRGFDTMTAPGPATGHFGLQGIRERIQSLDGTLKVETEPGAGTKASVSISLA